MEEEGTGRRKREATIVSRSSTRRDEMKAKELRWRIVQQQGRTIIVFPLEIDEKKERRE